jgi:hypothetical protein
MSQIYHAWLVLILSTFGQAVRVYHTESFDLVAELRGHGGAVTAFLPLGAGRFLSG